MFRTIDRELAQYGAGLDERPQVVVLNKIDLLPEPPEFAIDDERVLRVFRVSCATGAGIEELRRALFELCPPEPRRSPSKRGRRSWPSSSSTAPSRPRARIASCAPIEASA